MGPPIPHDVTKPPERDAKLLSAVAERWGPAAVEQLYALFPMGTRWTRFASRGRFAWVYADTPRSGSTLFARRGDSFAPFPMPRFMGATTDAFGAILADAQADIVASKDDVIALFAEVTGAQPILAQKDADALLAETWGKGSGADPAAVAQFEPPHFEGRTLAFVATFPFAAELVRVAVDADTLASRVQTLGRSQRQMMPVG